MNYDDKFLMGNKFDEIEVPTETDLIIEKAIKRAKNRHKKLILKTTGMLAASLAVIVVLNNTSPTFAKYINNASIAMENLFSKFNDKQINTAVKNGFVQGSFKDKNISRNSVSDKGVTVTIDQLSIDKNSLIIGYTSKVDSSCTWDNFNQEILEITDDTGRVLYDGRDFDDIMRDEKNKNKMYQEIVYYNSFSKRDINEESFKDSRIRQQVIRFSSSGTSKLNAIPKNINIKFTECSDISIMDVNHYYKKGYFYRVFHKTPKVIKGNWEINVEIDDKFRNAKEIKYVKANNTDENHLVKITDVNVYPMSVDSTFFVPKDWTVKNPYLEDDKGNIYECRGFGWGDDGEVQNVTADFQSPYFNKIKKLYLGFTYKVDGMDKKIKIELKQK
ncbi:DUF4179 domain-containing protein [Clostridium lundense]|uniref:DUF4179 domain-containing protein n=1 Tax=Clostridium lundense TaxID=319475 RepID=UPI0004883F19|nr:DUF4179 domain-containing protein [Clostridium lundense]